MYMKKTTDNMDQWQFHLINNILPCYAEISNARTYDLSTQKNYFN